MGDSLRADADRIVAASIRAVMPDDSVKRALAGFSPHGEKTVPVAAGKAA